MAVGSQVASGHGVAVAIFFQAPSPAAGGGVAATTNGNGGSAGSGVATVRSGRDHLRRRPLLLLHGAGGRRRPRALPRGDQRRLRVASKDTYLYGRFDIDIMLVANNSAGTVATFCLMPDGEVPWAYHDEIDLEFLGNATGEPYTLHTNIFVNDAGGREQQFQLWFDPHHRLPHLLHRVEPQAHHNPGGRHAYPRVQEPRVPRRAFPTWQRMRLQGTLWNADEWATQGGRVKTDWTQAPFYAYYRNLRVTPCAPSPGVAWCGDEPPESAWFERRLDKAALKEAQEKHMIYDYCVDEKRFKDKGFPEECKH
ncbi:hypothetical protein C2845_PM13G07290 [Panicum miliaceum]|uniref:Xyloglucan endotransglucosylase/hydrolase n=1 Tax=Panicum miliaceum TaxID=4540 RepID=A0A3L6RMX1_PANMI|nr:hypothetical protein C2845_PM13G07290 [Panicum miliaceum]